MPSKVPICCTAAYTEEAEQDGGFVPLFVGRGDGTVERYDAMQDAELGIPNAVFYAHRKAVTGIVAISATELRTCSLDGTMKQWTLDDAPQESVLAGGARVRASLVKTTTFPFGVSVMVPENGNRFLLGGDDGSLTLMEGERRSTWLAHIGGVVTAIAVDTEGSSAVLTGGTDGTIYVWDMEFGRSVCELRGHTGPIRALSFVPVPASIPVVRPKRSADGAELKDVLVHGNSEDGSTATCIVSCAADGTVKVWLLPDLREANAEAELLEPKRSIDPPRCSFGISFEEPTQRTGVEGEEQSGNSTAPPQEVGDRNDEADSHHNEQHAKPAAKPAGATDTEAEANEEAMLSDSVQELDAKEKFLLQQAIATVCKSAIKAPERRIVPFHTVLGTVELPQTPFSYATPSSFPSVNGGGEGEGAAGSSLLFIGAAQGEIYGLRTRLLVREVCLYTAQNFQKVQQEVAKVRKTLRDGTRVYTKAAAAKIKAEESTQLAIAAKARRAKLAEERAARRREAEERRAARRKAAEEADEDEEGEAEEDEEDEEDPFASDEDADAFNESEENALEDESEEEDEAAGGAADSADPQKPRRPASWKKLTEEQRAALEEFCTTQEAERDRRVTALRASVEAHIAQVQPLAKTTYHRSRAQFANLPYTTAGRIQGGTAVSAMSAASLVPGYRDKVYAVQENVIVPVTVALGLTKL
ncbi:hypothetical protein ABL78_7790 [Leptomonas seymouri]|uniref:Uncharacterized protein n=1 Tax=Leptomonas seymouri TaxID=5684 RepID=A0A0N1HTI6_LEPSE|nr:hypothetical protein ABL78_7790 [Leptomonas seymouri]|eukprot:KPI83190.1 hypothetical protein ABL78_7790 [Leptomonas seymouri]